MAEQQKRGFGRGGTRGGPRGGKREPRGDFLFSNKKSHAFSSNFIDFL